MFFTSAASAIFALLGTQGAELKTLTAQNKSLWLLY
jgi:hypothetical protein